MRILFQGDSITDAGRSIENDINFGRGYAMLVKANLGMEFPEKFEFFNRGTSGDRVVDIYARIKRDIINLKPDVMSVLVGVNDVWHEIDGQNGLNSEKYYKIYRMLIEEIKTALPNLKIIIMEPFVLKGTATENQWDLFYDEVGKRAQMAKKIAQEFQLPYIALQSGFEELLKSAPESYWLRDGVHPTEMGHEYIKNEWIKIFREMMEF